jgi:nitroreductase
MNVIQAVAERWSPRAYEPTPFPDAQLKQIFEAGRASHSCFNEQPWRVLFAKKDAGAARAQLEALLDPGNAFAKEAWILALSLGKKTFTKTGQPNRHNGHDVGSASQAMSLCAWDLGLGMRYMAGFNLDAARKLVPADYEPYSLFVIGHAQKGLEKPARERRPLLDSFFENGFELKSKSLS